jgi:L-threonylcarbamoyladenylate synthase
LNKNDIVPKAVTAGGTTVGVRMPEGEIARKLVELAGVPIATPSANISDKPSGTNYESIIADFHGKIDYFIDGGESKIGIASTIVKVEEGKPKILREGSISKEEIMKVLI